MADRIRRGAARPNERLRIARERLAKKPNEVARDTGLQYYDLEDFPDDLWMACPLREICIVCAYLKITPQSLFDEIENHASAGQQYTFTDIAELIRRHVHERSITYAAFADEAGWEVEEFVSDPDTGWEWSVDCLVDVCSRLGINWIDALPASFDKLNC